MQAESALLIIRPQPLIGADLDLIESLGGPGEVHIALHIPVSPQAPVSAADPGLLWLDPAFNPLSYWKAATILCEACARRFGKAPVVVPVLFPEDYGQRAQGDRASRALWKPTRAGAFLPRADRYFAWYESPEVVGLLGSLDCLEGAEVQQHPLGLSREVAAYAVAKAPEAVQRGLLGEVLFDLMAERGVLRLIRAQISARLAQPDLAELMGRSWTGFLDRLSEEPHPIEAHPGSEIVLSQTADFSPLRVYSDETTKRLIELAREVASLRGQQLERDAHVEEALRFIWSEMTDPDSLRVYHLAKGSYPESWVAKLRKIGVTLSPIPFVDFMGGLDVIWQRSLRMKAMPSERFPCMEHIESPDVRGYCLKRCDFGRRCAVPVSLNLPGRGGP